MENLLKKQNCFRGSDVKKKSVRAFKQNENSYNSKNYLLSMCIIGKFVFGIQVFEKTMYVEIKSVHQSIKVNVGFLMVLICLG